MKMKTESRMRDNKSTADKMSNGKFVFKGMFKNKDQKVASS